MKNFIFLIIAFVMLSACSHTSEPLEPDYNYIADHVTIAEKSSKHVVYEYIDIRVDEIAALAALYCQDQNGRQAHLDNIGLYRNHRRRATFVCLAGK